MNRDKIQRNIGRNIRKYRKKAGLSTSKAADAYGCTPKRWVLLEMGNPMTVDSLLRAAEVIRVPAWRLLK